VMLKLRMTMEVEITVGEGRKEREFKGMTDDEILIKINTDGRKMYEEDMTERDGSRVSMKSFKAEKIDG